MRQDVAVSMTIGYFTAAVLTSRNLTNWATQLPASEPNRELEQLVEKHAKRSAKFGGSEITEQLESKFNDLHALGKKPPVTKEYLAKPTAPTKLKSSDLFKKEPKEPFKKDPTKGHKVLLIGDSLMAGIGPALKNALATQKHIASHLIAKIGTGLARPDRYNWSEALRDELKDHQYKMVIVLLGTNDTQNIKVGKKGLRFGGPTWHSTYAARVHELMSTSCNASAEVYWLGLPLMRDREFNQKASHLNTVIKSIARSHKCVRYVALSDQGERSAQYTAYVSEGTRQIKVRAPDGIHYTPAGAKLMSELLMPKILNSADILALKRDALGSHNSKQNSIIFGDN
jgi:hypothetical protein